MLKVIIYNRTDDDFRVAKSLLVGKDILCLDSFIEYYNSLREFL